MKKQILMIFLVAFTLSIPALYAFENKKTHPAMTEKAAITSTIDDFLKTRLGLGDGINTQLDYNFPSEIKTRINRATWDDGKTQRSILEWLKVGSAIEDEDLFPKKSIRSRHHFYDPTRNTGLNNKDDNPDWTGWPEWAMGLKGGSALVWAIDGTAPYSPISNEQAWQSARIDFYNSLTESLKNDREKYLAMTFLDLGCVLHMLEDMGVPAHTRNDFLFAHYRKSEDYGEPLERWIEIMIPSDGSLARWISTGWMPTPQIFSKVSSYFDADIYTGNYLGDGIPTPGTWGLSERTNYQFLSWTTIFNGDFLNSLYYFPHPARIHTVDVNESGRIYLSGYGVNHLARKTMSAHHLQHNHLDKAWCVLGSAVYDDYAAITLPRTINYATGLANYFFRGRLKVEPNWTDPNFAKFVITNDSNNSGIPQTLKGGSFELYCDDKDGNRTQITDFVIAGGWNSGSTLAYDANITITFAKPAQAKPVKYVTVYKGNICQSVSDPDPCDANAIAVCVIRPGFEIIAWGRDDYGQISGVPAGCDFIAVAAGRRHALALKSDGSICAWGSNLYGQCDVPADGNVFYTAIAAGSRHSIALKSDGSIVVWGDDSLNQITNKPDGNDFVAIAAGEWHSLALKSDGSIVGWGGYNTYYECDAPPPDSGTVYVGISAGIYHSMALQSDGIPKAWGSNNQGQTRFYSGITGIAQVAACSYYSMVLRDDQWITTWGNSDWVTPNVLPRYHHRHADGTDFVAVAAGWDHILALTSDGEILSWNWPMGDYPFESFSRTVPEGIIFTEDISAGYDFSLALKAP